MALNAFSKRPVLVLSDYMDALFERDLDTILAKKNSFSFLRIKWFICSF